jgi:transcriptional regulator with XRE-family HTH domain
MKQRSKWSFDRAAFSRAVAAKLQADGLVLREVARQTGVSVPTLSRVQRHKPDVDTLVALCQWLGMTVDAFVER